jgi:hypothetical protein
MAFFVKISRRKMQPVQNTLGYSPAVEDNANFANGR